MTQTVHAAGARTGPMPTGGRYGWYRDHEGHEYRRVSTLVKEVETDRYNLDQWMLRQVAEGLALRDDLVLAVKAMGRPDPIEGWSREDKAKLGGIVKDAMNAAKQADGARKGTALHDLTERLDRGEAIESVVRGLPEATARTLRAYEFLRRENVWQTIEIERTVVCDELEVAGTFDRVERLTGLTALLGPGSCQYGDSCPDVGLPGHGDSVIADVKSEAQPWLNGLHIAPQLAIYSRARRMWIPTGGMVTVKIAGEDRQIADGRYVPAPCVRQDVGVVVHVLDGAAEPYFVNLAEGWEAAVAAYEQANRKSRAKRELGRAGAWFVPMPNVKRPAGPAPAEVAATAAQHAADRGGQRCLVCTEPVSPGTATCRKGHAVGLPPAQVATVRPDGMTEWRPEPAVGTQVTVGGVGFTKVDTVENVATRGPLDGVDKQAIEAVWAATDLAHLAKTFEIYTTQLGRTWGGRVAEAAEARRRQIECPQRALHSGNGKCACGWVAGVPA